MLYLYVKTHNKTGLKYLGKTSSKDPYKYSGSGKYWKRHLEKHGYDYTTDVILETESKEELIRVGIYYSNLWNVVVSKDWANLKVECGDGGWDYINNNKDKFINVEKKQQNFRKIGKKNKGTVAVIDKTGNKFRISLNDPRYLSGELIGHTAGKMAAYDANGQFYYVDKNDPRIKTGELRSNNAGKIYITNGTDRKLIYPSDSIPAGWYIGDNREKYNAGKIWITDGCNSKMIIGKEGIPPGYYPGRKFDPNRRSRVDRSTST